MQLFAVSGAGSECRAVLGQIGEYHFATGIFTPYGTGERTVIAADYPEEWVRHYYRNNYIDIDPTVTSNAHRLGPYSWDFPMHRASAVGRLFADVYDIGVRSGFTVPVHLPGGAIFVASFAAIRQQTDATDLPVLNWIAAQFYQRWALATSSEPEHVPPLTPRERDCLTWAARGKSSWDIGAIP